MYPKDVTRFIAWSKAMVAGAIVGKPDYGKTRRGLARRRKRPLKRRFRRKRRSIRRKNDA